ncbi:MAG: retropepsin-like aspartic protease [Pseudomonadota bacterium]
MGNWVGKLRPILLGCALIASGFGLGVWYTESRLDLGETAPQIQIPEQPKAGGSDKASPGVAQPTSFSAMLAAQQWYQAAAWLQTEGERITPADADLLIETIRQNVNKYDALAMRRMLSLYSGNRPDDVRSYFLLADLKLLEGLQDAALDSLLQVMGGGFPDDQVAQAKREADRIITNITNPLKQRKAHAELVDFWQYVSQRFTVSDAYRYEWANSLYLAGRLDESSRLLAETGTTDIAQSALDELARLISQARTGPGFETRGGQLIASIAAQPDGVDTFELLVDTGANVTSLSRRALRQLGATPTGRNVSVRTAGGPVETEIYVLPVFFVQGQQVSNLRVLRLPTELPGMDGLLGTDVLQQFNWMPVDSL